MKTAAFLLSAVLAAGMLAGCGDPVEPAPCATYQNAEGIWVEPDGEEFDNDPCDREPDKVNHPSKATATKPPVKPATTPKPKRS